MAEQMTIQVNGQPHRADPGITIGTLLQELDIRPDRVAVEVNSQILERQEFGTRGLRNGDRVEIISFIGGGTEESTKL
ncbi:MAG: sulfur carrier protein ThiS [Nitrospirales bacterium]